MPRHQALICIAWTVVVVMLMICLDQHMNLISTLSKITPIYDIDYTLDPPHRRSG